MEEMTWYAIAAVAAAIALVVGGVLPPKHVSLRDRLLVVAGPIAIALVGLGLPQIMQGVNFPVVRALSGLAMILSVIALGSFSVMVWAARR